MTKKNHFCLYYLVTAEMVEFCLYSIPEGVYFMWKLIL